MRELALEVVLPFPGGFLPFSTISTSSSRTINSVPGFLIYSPQSVASLAVHDRGIRLLEYFLLSQDFKLFPQHSKHPPCVPTDLHTSVCGSRIIGHSLPLVCPSTGESTPCI